jgi:serine/threonine-protein kinase
MLAICAPGAACSSDGDDAAATGGAASAGGAPNSQGGTSTAPQAGLASTAGRGGTSGGAPAAAKGGSAGSAAGTSSGGKASGGQTSGGRTSGGRAGAASTGGTGNSASGGTQANGDGICGAEKGQLFGPDYPWNQRIDAAPLDTESAQIIAYLAANHTDSRRFRIDGPSDEVDSLYGITILTADASTPHQSFEPTDDFYEPDCDPAPPPIPSGGAIEGESSYACDGDGDCHLIVIDTEECRLFEMWRANRSGSAFEGGCQAVWDLNAPYAATLRGDCCSSADAAGLPIAAHMFSADEIAAGEIPHAIRFILPNEHMRERIYVRPATHSTGATSGPAAAPPYGARLRLKASFDDSGLNSAARIVARALKSYGMILSDGGNLTFTAVNDRFTAAKWRDVELAPGDLTSLSWDDFEVPELGERYAWDNGCDCQRSPIED